MPTGIGPAKAIAAGWDHNIVLLNNGQVVAWDDGTMPSSYNLSNVPSWLNNVTAISARGYHSLALRADGTVVAWGLNTFNQTNVPSGLTGVVAVAAGGYHSLALKSDGTVVAWGRNVDGQCTVPAGLNNVIAIAAGAYFSLALKNDGTMVAWGANLIKVLNLPPVTDPVKLIAAGEYHALEVVYSPYVTYPVDPSQDLLLLYNSNSANSINVCNYYLQHRPLAGNANILPINCPWSDISPANDTICRANFDNVVRPQIQQWLDSNPTKRPQYWILFLELPARISEGAYGTFPDSSVSYDLYSKSIGIKPFITHINMNGTNDCRAYIDKLASFANGKAVLSATAQQYGNTTYYVDNVVVTNYLGNDSVSRAETGLLNAGVPQSSICYLSGGEPPTLPHLTNCSNVAGYIGWGSHSSLGINYVIDGSVKFSGDSDWYIIETIESYNGDRAWAQGLAVQWFSATAFGGTAYSVTPVGAVSHTDEPHLYGVNDSQIYFGLWASGKSFASAAWNSRRTPYFQAVGDPLVSK